METLENRAANCLQILLMTGMILVVTCILMDGIVWGLYIQSQPRIVVLYAAC